MKIILIIWLIFVTLLLMIPETNVEEKQIPCSNLENFIRSDYKRVRLNDEKERQIIESIGGN